MALLERPDVCVIGGGVVGAAVALALALRGADVTVLEAEAEPGLAASGTNSGILHTGFDSTPGELETRLILRSSQLRGGVGSNTLPQRSRSAANSPQCRAASAHSP